MAITASLSGHAIANDEAIARQSTAKASEEVVQEAPEKITVTGSRLKRDSFSVTTPLVTMDRASIQDTGLGNLSDVLIDNMPALSESIGNTTSQSSISGTGLSTVQLRDLGANRTLTLIDDRRVVSNSYDGNYVSLNTIPSGMVERVEIISGGASATYGADAVAGVVNIITQSKKEGFEFQALFGEGSITPEMADWIRTNQIIDTEIQQYTVMGYITGDLYELPAGNVSAVFSAEYRKDSQSLDTSDDMKAGGITFNVVPSFYGEVEVYEAFAELAVPLLKDVPFAKSLSAETSLRLANYSIDNISTVASYKLGLLWQPIDGYMLRANYARAQRAPTITELLSPPSWRF